MRPGHFYSPYPNLTEVRRRRSVIFDRARRELPGVDLAEASQLELLKALRSYYDELPYTADGSRQPHGLRYRLDNPRYAYSDGILFYCMLRHFKPRRYVEVGSGWSSCLALDVAGTHLPGLEVTLVEPYPATLLSLLRPGDRGRFTLVEKPLQDVPLSVFEELGDGDFLFVDSTHVSKTGSDVNHLFFEILPRLAAGVHVHLHDVHFPFEYPEEWVLEGRAWSEAYVLRAFLEFNSAFEIELFNTYLEEHHRGFFEAEMPLCLVNPGGSIWLRRV